MVRVAFTQEFWLADSDDLSYVEVYKAGQVFDLEEDEAAEAIDAGCAIELDAEVE